MRRQSEHYDDYRAALAQLDAHGSDLSELRKPRRNRAAGGGTRSKRTLAARSRRRAALSRATRRSMAAAERARRMAAAEPYALRLDMAAALARTGPLTWMETGAGPAGETGAIAADPAAWGDVILARKETPTSYHLAVVVDDAAQGVTDVVRGRDLFHATSVHRLLQALLGLAAAALPSPPADPRRRRPQAVEIDLGHRLARAARARRQPPPTSARPSGSIERGFRGIVAIRGGGRMAKQQAQKAAAAKARARAGARRRPARAIEAALAGIAHDIRTPLTGIVALAELLASSDLGAREREWANAIKSGADHLAALTTLIVDAAKADAAGLVLRNEPFSPRALAEAVGARAHRAGRQQGHQGRNHDRARSAGDGGRRRTAPARGAGKSRRQCGEIHQQGTVVFTAGAEPAGARPRAADVHRRRHRHRHERASELKTAVPPVRAGERADRQALRRRRARPGVRQARRQGDGRRSCRHQQDRAAAAHSALTVLVERVDDSRRGPSAPARAPVQRARCRSCAPRTIPTAAW